MALAAGLADVGGDTVAHVEALDILADFDDLTDGFVAGNEGELGVEVALVDVSVGSAETADCDCRQKGPSLLLTLEEEVVVADFGDGNGLDGELAGLVVDESLHFLGDGHFERVLSKVSLARWLI